MTRQARSRLSSGPDCDSLRPAYVWLFVVLLLFCDWLFSIVSTPEGFASLLSSGFLFSYFSSGHAYVLLLHARGFCFPAFFWLYVSSFPSGPAYFYCLLHMRSLLPCFGSPLFDIFWAGLFSIVVTPADCASLLFFWLSVSFYFSGPGVFTIVCAPAECAFLPCIRPPGERTPCISHRVLRKLRANDEGEKTLGFVCSAFLCCSHRPPPNP